MNLYTDHRYQIYGQKFVRLVERWNAMTINQTIRVCVFAPRSLHVFLSE